MKKKRDAVKTWSTPVQEEARETVPCILCGGRSFRSRLRCEGFSYVRCQGCGLVQMNPQPVNAEVRTRYGEEYLSYELANEKSFLRLQELALSDAGFFEIEGEILGQGRRGRVLDIGCATGALLKNLQSRGWETAGLEISAPQADYARRERGLDVRSLPAEESRFPPGSFDAVLASHLIEHLNNPAALVSEAWRILSPGGRFYVTTPNLAGLQSRLFGSRWRSAIFDHLYLFSAKTLSALLKKAGFQIEKLVTWGGLAVGLAPRPLKRAADIAAKRFGFGDVMILRSVKP